MTGNRRRVIIGASFGAAVAMFCLAMPLNPAAAMPVPGAMVHGAQAGLPQVEKVQGWWGPGWGGGWRPGWGRPGWGRPGWRPGWGRRRVCFWRFGRRVCVWR